GVTSKVTGRRVREGECEASLGAIPVMLFYLLNFEVRRSLRRGLSKSMSEAEEDRHLKLAGETDCIPEPLPTLRHSTAHLMAQAVTQLFPGVKVAIGPAIEDGFYYDFSRPAPFTVEDLERIEARMRELAKQDLPYVREEKPREEAIRFFEQRQEPFKV